MIVPSGGISLDGTHWVRCKPGFLLPVRVLSRLFRRLFLAALADAHAAGRLAFFGEIEGLCRRDAFAAHLAPLKRKNWFVYAKPPFSGPQAVLAYLARYTHRVAISNSRLVALDERGVTFRYKDYRRNGQARYRSMTLRAGEFIRRFLLHVLPKGFHRIRHLYNIINNVRKDLAVLPSYRPPSSNGFHIPFRLSVGPAVKPRFQAIWRGLVEGKLQFASAPASASSQRREKDRPEHSDDRVFAHRIARAPGRGGRKGRDAAGADQQAEKKKKGRGYQCIPNDA